MTITNRTRKLLWGRSGNRCVICRDELIMGATPQDDESVVGDECHIVSAKAKGPRYDPSFPLNKLDAYPNLLLLCRIHHKVIDDQSKTYTVDKLRNLKVNHEIWVSETLNLSQSGSISSQSDAQADDFGKIKAAMPELIAELKEDLTKEGNEFIREFFLIKKNWSLSSANPCFVYYFDDHENLQGKVHVLENYGFVYDVTSGNAKKYRMNEELIEFVLST